MKVALLTAVLVTTTVDASAQVLDANGMPGETVVPLMPLHKHRHHDRQPASPSPAFVPESVPEYHTEYGSLSEGQVAAYARAAGFPDDVIDTMVAIAYRESRWDPEAINAASGACGLMQLYPCPGAYALDPATNMKLAYAKYRASGLAPWGL